MKKFALPVLAALACLPCILPAFLILIGSIGLLLATGLFVLPLLVVVGSLSAIALMRRTQASCSPRSADPADPQ